VKWETLNSFHENFGPLSLLGRETMADVVLPHRLKAAIEKLNPGVSPNAVEIAIQEVTKDRGALSPARANQSVSWAFPTATGAKAIKARTLGQHSIFTVPDPAV